MYKPKTISFATLFFPVFFTIMGLFFLFPIISDFSLFGVSIVKGTIIETSSSPRANFHYNNLTYIIESQGSSTCNGKPCSSQGDSTLILVNEKYPEKSIYISDLLFLLIFPTIGIIFFLIWVYVYKNSIVNTKRLEELISLGLGVETVIIDMEVERTKSKNGTSRIIGYKYICKDPKSGREYDADIISNPEFEVGSSVRVICDELRYPGLYWVDLNTVRQTQVGTEIATEYQERKLQKDEDDIRNLYTHNTLSYGGSIILLCGIGALLCGVGFIFSSFLVFIFGVIFLLGGIYNVSYFLRDRKMQKIRSRNISFIANIQSVGKVGNWKVIPFGFIPQEEMKVEKIDVSTINDGEVPRNLQSQGYRYFFRISVNGMIRDTEIFMKPFPKKYFPGMKIRLYFNDISYTGDFMTDFDSIDELN